MESIFAQHAVNADVSRRLALDAVGAVIQRPASVSVYIRCSAVTVARPDR